MFHAPPSTFVAENRTETARKIARFAVQPRLIGTFARAAYHGALAMAARLAASAAPDPRLTLLTDMYIHWQHGVPYKVVDAALIVPENGEQRRHLIARLCRDGVVQRRRTGTAREPLRDTTEIELTPTARAELSGYFARLHAEPAGKVCARQPSADARTGAGAAGSGTSDRL